MLQEHLEKLISADYKLIALETNSPEQSINDFRPLAKEGKAIYLWDSNTGLYRMEVSHINIPNTQTPEMVIKHIQQNKLYGIYLLVGFSQALSEKNLHSTFNQIISEQSSNKVVILIDHSFDYPQKLINNILIVQEPDISR